MKKILSLVLMLFLFFGTATTGYAIDMPSPECPGDPDKPCPACYIKYICMPVPYTGTCIPFFYLYCNYWDDDQGTFN